MTRRPSNPAVLKILRVQGPAAGQRGGTNDERVPDGEVVKAMQVERGQHVIDVEPHDVQVREHLDTAPRLDGR